MPTLLPHRAVPTDTEPAREPRRRRCGLGSSGARRRRAARRRGRPAPVGALPSVEAVAVQRVAAWRADRFVADLEARGRLTLEALDVASRVGARYHAALDKEALTLSARLAARRQSVDLATLLSSMDDDEEAE